MRGVRSADADAVNACDDVMCDDVMCDEVWCSKYCLEWRRQSDSNIRITGLKVLTGIYLQR